MVEENFSEDSSNESPILEEEKFDVIYECLRCKVQVSMIELNRLPEIKCICGFRVFTKVRPPLVTTVKAL
jgi:DNA-directed RNA polymerase subunit P|tara:strand:+ start:363 stop:572 length:210 start_codon:yes stop_codon:yes gene_type:complete